MTFAKLNALLWGTTLLLMFPFLGFSANIAIIESQSNHPMQTMDGNWELVINNLGHTSTTFPQNALDNLSSFDGYDVLIISSGLIDLPMNRRATAKAFFNSGRNMYLQSEYLLSHPGNMMFAEIVVENGNAFTWEGETSGSVTPMSVVCGLSNVLNEVTGLSYFWYGTYGTGDETVIPFLQSADEKAYGFTYKPTDENMGKVITTTDQDWVRILSSEALLENIVYMLTIDNNTNTVQPTVFITSENNPTCINEAHEFSATIENPNNNSILEWQINGVPVANSNATTFANNDLMEGDVVECVIILEEDCETYTHLSNPLLIATILPISETTFSINTTQIGTCEGDELIFSSNIQSEGTYTVIAYQWQVNNLDVTGENAADFSTTNLSDNDIVLCNLQFADVCGTLNLATSNEINIALNPMLTPTIEIIANNTTACQGTGLTFNLQGTNWGDQSAFQWQVNGANVGNNENTLNISSLEDGQQVTCILTSSASCLTTNQISADPVVVSINENLVPTLNVTASATTACPAETVTFTASGENWGSNPFFAWTVNGQSGGDNAPVFSTNALSDNAAVSCTIYLDDPCLSISQLNEVADPVAIIGSVTPIITISSDVTAACKGTEITFTSNIQNGGANPVYTWMINNNAIDNNTSTFTTTDLEDGQIVSCQLVSDVECSTTFITASNYINVAISDITLIVNQKNDDYCGMGTGKIQVGSNYAFGQVDYIWSNGDTNKTIKNLAAGTYEVSATDALGCIATLSVVIEEANGLEIENLDIQEPGCSGNNGFASVTMKDNARNYFYTWMTKDGDVLSMESTVRDLASGSYLLEITDETDCYLIEEFVVGGSTMVTLEMESTMNANWGDQVKLEPYITGSGNLTYEWSPAAGLSCSDCPSPTFEAELGTTYTLTVMNEAGCSITKSVLVQVKKEHEVYIPNAFSPNGDGQNDSFTAFAGDKVHTIKSMTVADRWGNILFKKQDFDANDEQAGWDGTARGQRLNVGVYVYTMEVEFIDGLVRSFGGDVTLAR